jgi:hypothetical protein
MHKHMVEQVLRGVSTKRLLDFKCNHSLMQYTCSQSTHLPCPLAGLRMRRTLGGSAAPPQLAARWMLASSCMAASRLLHSKLRRGDRCTGDHVKAGNTACTQQYADGSTHCSQAWLVSLPLHSSPIRLAELVSRACRGPTAACLGFTMPHTHASAPVTVQ